MLIQKSAPALGDVVTIKLVNGQELIGKLGIFDAERLTLNRPIEIAMQMVGPSQASLGFGPFLASVSDDQAITFDRDHVLAGPVATRKDVAAQYIKATTGLTIPGDKPQTGLIGF